MSGTWIFHAFQTFKLHSFNTLFISRLTTLMTDHDHYAFLSMFISSFLICLTYSMSTFLFIHQDHASLGSHLVRFKSFIGTLLIIDR